MEHQEDPDAGRDPSKQEVVFVLRVRAGERGWRGQVKRLDTGSIRNVAGMPELFTILEQDWSLVLGRDPPED